MTRLLRALVVATLAAMACACSSPVSGTWTANETMSGMASSYALELDNGGSAKATVTVPTGGIAMCSGSIVTTGLSWTTGSINAGASGIGETAENTLGVSGPGSCSGTITCMTGGGMVTLGCNDVNTSTFNYGNCPYTVSTDGNTLSVQCPNVSGGYVYARSTM